MKKIFLLLMVLILPANLHAYSEQVLLGGQNVGIEAYSKGVIVVGFYKVDNRYIGSKTLNVGDIILEIEGYPVNSIKEMTDIIDKNIKDGKVNVLIKRNNKEKETTMSLVKEGSVYKTGLYIKEKITGIGTITYIDPNTKITGLLGHELTSALSNNKIEVRNGKLYSSAVSGIDRSTNGRVGSKNAKIDYNNSLGIVNKNSSVGIFGTYKSTLPNNKLLNVAKWDEIELGKATIYTTINDSTILPYEITITKLNKSEISTNKSISFTVTDNNLLSVTGGIVQGMSGSPIVQNGKIIGAVTHVLVDDVVKGYAVFIRTMLEEGDR